jgi:cation transport regulator ChaC
MASKKEPYEIKSTRNDREMKKLTRQGWELIGQSGGSIGTASVYTLRRSNPKYEGPATQLSAVENVNSGDGNAPTLVRRVPRPLQQHRLPKLHTPPRTVLGAGSRRSRGISSGGCCSSALSFSSA